MKLQYLKKKIYFLGVDIAITRNLNLFVRNKMGLNRSNIMNYPWLKNYPEVVPAEVDVKRFNNLCELFDESCKKYREKPALSNMGVTLSFHEYDHLTGQFASFLQHELKLKKGDRIAIQMPNLLQYNIALFGAFRAGLVVVNTNPLYTAREMEHQFKDSGAKAIVILANFAHLLSEVLPNTNIQHVIITEVGDLLGFPKKLIVNTVVKYVKKAIPSYSLPKSISFNRALELGRKKPYQEVRAKYEDIAFLQYTGGTTGVSKGAMLSHGNVISNSLQICAWFKTSLTEGEEVAICALPLYHIFSLTLNALSFMLYGAKVVLITNPRDMAGFIKELRSAPFSVFSGVNTLFNGLMNHPEFTTINFSKVKVSVAGGMALQVAVAEKWMKITNSLLIEGYGLTETSPVATVNPISMKLNRVGSIGLPLPNTVVKLLDDNGKEVAQGEQGEIAIKGPQVMQGYWERPDETSKVMTDDGFFKSGDIGIMSEDGYFKIVDRKKDMILVSGFNVYPNEIEDVLANLNGVLESAAIGVPDEKSGEAVKVVIVKKDPTLTSEQVIQHCRQNLTNYKVPRFVEFRHELPKTNVGKILRRALRDAQK
jgi:long-chain acyl-CoA synthetase